MCLYLDHSGLNHLTSYEEQPFLSLTSVIKVSQPTREATICLKTTTATPKVVSVDPAKAYFFMKEEQRTAPKDVSALAV